MFIDLTQWSHFNWDKTKWNWNDRRQFHSSTEHNKSSFSFLQSRVSVQWNVSLFDWSFLIDLRQISSRTESRIGNRQMSRRVSVDFCSFSSFHGFDKVDVCRMSWMTMFNTIKRDEKQRRRSNRSNRSWCNEKTPDFDCRLFSHRNGCSHQSNHSTIFTASSNSSTWTVSWRSLVRPRNNRTTTTTQLVSTSIIWNEDRSVFWSFLFSTCNTLTFRPIGRNESSRVWTKCVLKAIRLSREKFVRLFLSISRRSFLSSSENRSRHEERSTLLERTRPDLCRSVYLLSQKNNSFGSDLNRFRPVYSAKDFLDVLSSLTNPNVKIDDNLSRSVIDTRLLVDLVFS